MSSLLLSLYRYFRMLRCLILCIFASSILLFPLSSVSAASHPKPTLTVNVQQGPLGVALTVKGKNFHAGKAMLKYVDAQHVIGMFEPPSENSVQVQRNGTFIATNLILPSTGPTGKWNIVVTDSARATATVQYLVLASPGEQSAVAPSILINPTSGKADDVIAVSGSNWLPQGTPCQTSVS